MIGDAANLASRLEGANKVFGSSILVSDTTQVGAVEGIVWRKLGDIRVVGKNNVVPVFEPLDSVVHSRLLSQIVTYRAAIAAFEALDIDKAQELFQQIDADPVSAVYLARIARARQDGGLATHVWNLTEK
jgi:adenylate cyclase